MKLDKLLKQGMVAVLLLSSALVAMNCDDEPEQYENIVDESSGSCPGVNTCTKVVTEGSYYCDSCWFWGCGCIVTDNALVFKTTYAANCVVITVSVGGEHSGVTEERAECESYSETSYTMVAGSYAMGDNRCGSE